jgi:lactoylglutathione lyase
LQRRRESPDCRFRSRQRSVHNREQQCEGEASMANITWDHIHLKTPDPEEMAAWFEKMLGAEATRNPVHAGERIDLKLGGANIFIQRAQDHNPPPQIPYRGLEHFGFLVPSVDEIAAELKAKGCEFTKEPTTVRKGIRICFIRGPQGISIELLERNLS